MLLWCDDVPSKWLKKQSDNSDLMQTQAQLKLPIESIYIYSIDASLIKQGDKIKSGVQSLSLIPVNPSLTNE